MGGLNENFCKTLNGHCTDTSHNSKNHKIEDRMFFQTFCFVYFQLTMSKNNDKIKRMYLKSSANQCLFLKGQHLIP